LNSFLPRITRIAQIKKIRGNSWLKIHYTLYPRDFLRQAVLGSGVRGVAEEAAGFGDVGVGAQLVAGATRLAQDGT